MGQARQMRGNAQLLLVPVEPIFSFKVVSGLKPVLADLSMIAATRFASIPQCFHTFRACAPAVLLQCPEITISFPSLQLEIVYLKFLEPRARLCRFTLSPSGNNGLLISFSPSSCLLSNLPCDSVAIYLDPRLSRNMRRCACYLLRPANRATCVNMLHLVERILRNRRSRPRTGTVITPVRNRTDALTEHTGSSHRIIFSPPHKSNSRLPYVTSRGLRGVKDLDTNVP
jgi:hypothetical protein